MIYNLKIKIEQKCGFDIKSKKDCLVLSDIIYYETSYDLNYNTLRRFFGIIKGTKPSGTTLDILSIYVGYESYSQFCSKYPIKQTWDYNQKIFNIIYVDPSAALEIIEKNNDRSEYYIELLIMLVYGSSIQKKYDSLKFIFNSELLNPERFSYSQMLYFGNCIGPIIIQSKLDYLKLINTKYFTFLFFNTYIDISNLNCLYGSYALKIYKSTKDKHQKLFANCILELKNFLNNKDCKSIKTTLGINEIHPILYGRYMSTFIFAFKDKKQRVEHVINYLNIIRNKDNVVDYIYEFTIGCILSKEIEILKEINFFLIENKTSKPYYQEYHFSIIDLLKIIIKVSQGIEVAEEILIFKNKSFLRNSHKELIKIILLVIEYHNSKKENKILSEYLILSKKLKYPLFDKKYCLSYFKN